VQQVVDAASKIGKRATAAASVADVALRSKTILTMLPNGKIVADVYYNHLLPAVQPGGGTVLIDSSTIDPTTSRESSEAASQKGCLFFDAPVSGGVNGAAAGQLTFMVGASDAATFRVAEKWLTGLSKSVVHCGPVGCGQVCKLCNNLILGQHMVAVSEAMLLGTRLGVDPKTLAGVVNTSTGRCWSSDSYNPFPGVIPTVPSSNEYRGGFAAALMLKDLGLALQAAKTAKLEVRGGERAHEVYAEMVNTAKMGELDFSGILKYIDNK
jgi:3-hydroxyisobutyrate dehydrogenase